jgi:hypothetical protein
VDAARPARPAGARRPALRRLAELLALTGFALAMPVLDVTGQSPDFFLFRRPSPGELRLLVLLVALAPGVGLWVVERAVGLVHRVAEPLLHLVLVWLLCALIVIQVGKRLDAVVGIPLAVVAAVAGLALAVATVRLERFRQLLMYAAPAPLVAVLAFTLTTPAGSLVRPIDGSDGIVAVAGKRSPIVFLLLDEFPTRALLDDNGGIDKRLFPNFARLAARSNWFPNSTAVIGSTAYAIPSLLNGRYPRQKIAPSYVEFPENLFTLLAGTYDVKAYEAVTQLCPPSVCSGIPAGHATGLRALVRDVAGVARDIVSPYPQPPGAGEAFAEGIETARRAGEGKRGELAPDFMLGGAGNNEPERFPNFLAGLEPSGEPTLHLLHMLMPHIPYRRVPSGLSYREPPRDYVVPTTVDHVAVENPDVATVVKQRLLLQVAYVDVLIGQLLDRLEQTGLWDDALLVVTSDHGVGVEPHASRRYLDRFSAPDLTRVPLFIKTPGQRAGRVDRRNIQHVDVLPTIADIIEVQVPWKVDGRSVFGPARAEQDKPWQDQPERPPVRFDPTSWSNEQLRSMAEATARPELGPRGLFAVGPLKALVHRRVADLTVGAPSTIGAALAPGLELDRLDAASQVVPAMLWGDIDAPPEDQHWLAVAVNGAIAGCVPVVRGTDSAWHFMGMVSDAYFRAGVNDVVLYSFDGGALHEVPWSR